MTPPPMTTTRARFGSSTATGASVARAGSDARDGNDDAKLADAFGAPLGASDAANARSPVGGDHPRPLNDIDEFAKPHSLISRRARSAEGNRLPAHGLQRSR